MRDREPEYDGEEVVEERKISAAPTAPEPKVFAPEEIHPSSKGIKCGSTPGASAAVPAVNGGAHVASTNGGGNGAGNGGAHGVGVHGSGNGGASKGYSLPTATGSGASAVAEPIAPLARARLSTSPVPPVPLSASDKAKLQGYTGDACGECGSFTMVRNGSCLKCETCGATSGCS